RLPLGSGALRALGAGGPPPPRLLLREPPGDEPFLVRTRSADAAAAGDDHPGRYQILGEGARGGMGPGPVGRGAALGRDLAIKVLLEQHRSNPDAQHRFIEEAQIGGQLQHPGIVPIYELGVFPDLRPYFAMKLVKGRTLATLLRDRPDPAADRPRLLAI